MLRFDVYQESTGSLLGDLALGSKGTWRWRLWSNSDVIAQGEDYVDRADCLNAIHSVMATNFSTPIRER